MAKLTRYTSFEKLKAADVSAKAVSTDQRTHQSEFEALLTRLRKDFTQQKKAKGTMSSTLKEVLVNINAFKEEAPIFAKRVEKEFRPDSEAVVLELTEEELDLPTDEMAALKCPGLDYFLDVFIVQEMVADFENASPPVPLDERMAVIIHYAEYNA